MASPPAPVVGAEVQRPSDSHAKCPLLLHPSRGSTRKATLTLRHTDRLKLLTSCRQPLYSHGQMPDRRSDI